MNGLVVSAIGLVTQGFGIWVLCTASRPFWCDGGTKLCSPVPIGESHLKESTMTGKHEIVKKHEKCDRC